VVDLESAFDPVAVTEDDKGNARTAQKGLNAAHEINDEFRAAPVEIVNHDKDRALHPLHGLVEMPAEPLERITAPERQPFCQRIRARPYGLGEKRSKSPQEADACEPAKQKADAVSDDKSDLGFVALSEDVDNSSRRQTGEEGHTHQRCQEQRCYFRVSDTPADLGHPEAHPEILAFQPTRLCCGLFVQLFWRPAFVDDRVKTAFADGLVEHPPGRFDMLGLPRVEGHDDPGTPGRVRPVAAISRAF